MDPIREYWYSLTEEERAVETRGFHQFLVKRGLVGKTLSKYDTERLFEEYCQKIGAQEGHNIMGWYNVMFIMRIHQACERSDDRCWFTILKWPPQRSYTPTVALNHYMASRKEEVRVEVSGASGTSKQERILAVMRAMREHRSALIQNKKGVRIASQFDGNDGKISVGKLYVGGGRKAISIQIDVEEGGTPQRLINCDFLEDVREFALSDEHRVCDGLSSVTIKPGSSYEITAKCEPRGLGRPRAIIAFQFKDIESSLTYHIIRFLLAHITDEDAELLQPTAPYRRPKYKRRAHVTHVVNGIPLPWSSLNRLVMTKPLGRYSIPDAVRSSINGGVISGECKELVEADLSRSTYDSKFHALIYVEELQMEKDINMYTMRNASPFSCERGYYIGLKIPGLAENRPSVLKGDQLFFRKSGESIEYQGYVHEVRLEEVRLKFARKFHDNFFDGAKFHVRFTFNRLSLQLWHRASERLARDQSTCRAIGFPTSKTVAQEPLLCQIEEHSNFVKRLFNRDLRDNPEQCQAVQHIVAGTSRPAPYLVFGPPGTGKTMTTVEAIKQVWRVIKGSRILACTPSNSAADDLASRLLENIPKTEIFRMNAFSRHADGIDPRIRDAIMGISLSDDGTFCFPSVEELRKYRIIVSTLVTAGRLASAEFDRDHFTHVFVDESGHAVEPECMIPVAGLLNIKNPNGGQLVLAGDPKQLGPILRSPISIKNGLELSLLERLMKTCSVYKKRATGLGPNPSFDSRVVTKLVQNYRSHPAILKLPNELFYDNELEVKADQLVRESLCKWDHLPKKGFPIIFHGIEGIDEREESSPSFFNTDEASQVAKYVDMINSTRTVRINLSQIGVISPYKKQVQKIRQLLKRRHFDAVKVGSVEEFQGSERLVIIISTVRSQKKFLETDEKFSLGFLKNPKRFNVAITRAKALLIVIGNPFLLNRDEYWNALLEYCREKGGYTGCHYVPRDQREDDILRRFQELHLDRDASFAAAESLTSEETGGVSLKAEQEDPEWEDREGH